MNIVPEIFYPLTIGIPIFIYAFFKWPKYAIAGIIIAKPIIDLTVEYYILLNINFLKIYAGLLVILGTIYIIYYRPKILRHPLSIIWLIFLGLNVVSIFIISDAFMLIDKIKYFLSILTGFITLALFAHLFDFEKDKKFVISIFIIAGIFPLLLWLIPVVLGNPIISNDPLRRIIGPYHDFKVFMYVAVQTIICCLAYLAIAENRKLKMNDSNKTKDPWYRDMLQYLKNKVSLRSILLYSMVVISVIIVYKCYSKAGWITLGAIFFIWFLLQKKYIFTALVPVIAAIIIFVNPFAKDFQKTFQNEIDYFLHGTDTKDIVFRGRLNRWVIGMEDFGTLPGINILFGANRFIGSPENAYVRTLWDSGMIGLVVFLTLLGLTGYLLISKYVKNKNPFILTGILIFVMFLVNSIGEHPMFFPSLQWFMWGTTGFILSNNKTAVGTKN